eukprot:480368-Ditylum_brightwellii.AAC.1
MLMHSMALEDHISNTRLYMDVVALAIQTKAFYKERQSGAIVFGIVLFPCASGSCGIFHNQL